MRLAPSSGLQGWIGRPAVADADRDALVTLQTRTLQAIRARNPTLSADFVDRAIRYSIIREAFGTKLTGPKPQLATLPFQVENTRVLLDAAGQGRGVILLAAHCGFWIAAPLWLARQGIRHTFLFEAAPPRLTRLYARLGVIGIQAVDGVDIRFTDGHVEKVPGSQPLREVKQALEAGTVTALFGDTFRERGRAASVLGTGVRLIDHYACVAVRMRVPVVYLRQWTTDAAVHLDFVPVAAEYDAREKVAAVARLVGQFARLLDGDLRRRPEQYAYGPESIFARAGGAPVSDDVDVQH